MTDPVPVAELEAREDVDFPVKPGTNEEAALRFLAAHPDYGWPPKEIANRTDVPESSVTKTAARLYEKGLVNRSLGYYFVAPERLDEVQGFLGDLHQLAELAGEPGQEPVHPAGRADRGTEASAGASEDEIVEIVEDAAATQPSEPGE